MIEGIFSYSQIGPDFEIDKGYGDDDSPCVLRLIYENVIVIGFTYYLVKPIKPITNISFELSRKKSIITFFDALALLIYRRLNKTSCNIAY